MVHTGWHVMAGITVYRNTGCENSGRTTYVRLTHCKLCDEDVLMGRLLPPCQTAHPFNRHIHSTDAVWTLPGVLYQCHHPKFSEQHEREVVCGGYTEAETDRGPCLMPLI